VATAEDIYADPSALIPLYLHQPRSRAIVAWRARLPGSLPVTHHGRAEIANAIGLAQFRGEVSSEKAIEAWGALDHDFAEGNLQQTSVMLRAALNQAIELSRTHSPTLGTRASDVLHVACAMELKLKHFLTFDERQQKLAAACGLKPVKL
jgi:predicted nucleic acid-binding protein